MKKVMLIMLGIMSLLLSGCGKKADVTVYKYEKTDETMSIKLEKCKVTDQEFTLFYKAERSGTVTDVICYDASFQEIAADAEIVNKDYEVIIKTEDARKISGLFLYFDSDFRTAFRYLETKQYAQLEYIFVCDIGTMEMGDTDAYYTEEERAKKDAARKREEEIHEANFQICKGPWIREDEKEEIWLEKRSGESVLVIRTYSDEKKEWEENIASAENIILDYDSDQDILEQEEIEVSIHGDNGLSEYFGFVLKDKCKTLVSRYGEEVYHLK